MSQSAVVKKEGVSLPSTATETVVASHNLSPYGTWSLFGLLALLVLFTVLGGVSYADIAANFFQFMTGNLAAVNGSDETTLSIVLNVTAIMLMLLVVVIVTAKLFITSSKSYVMDVLIKALDQGQWSFFKAIVFEEVLARGIFLVVLWHFLPGTVWFYILFFIGNAIFAYIHLSNFRDPKERQLIRLLPQILGGIAFTYIFVRYGFWVTVMAHYFYDVVLLSSIKKKESPIVNILTTCYYLVGLVILAILASSHNIGLDSLIPWFKNQLVALEGFSFGDYVIVLLLVDTLVAITANLLLLDYPFWSEDDKSTLASSKNVFFFLFISFAHAGVIFLLNALLSLVIYDAVTRAITLSILIGFAKKAQSGSSFARQTLIHLPSNYLMVVSYAVLGFGPAFALSMAFLIYHWLPKMLESNEAELAAAYSKAQAEIAAKKLADAAAKKKNTEKAAIKTK